MIVIVVRVIASVIRQVVVRGIPGIKVEAEMEGEVPESRMTSMVSTEVPSVSAEMAPVTITEMSSVSAETAPVTTTEMSSVSAVPSMATKMSAVAPVPAEMTAPMSTMPARLTNKCMVG